VLVVDTGAPADVALIPYLVRDDIGLGPLLRGFGDGDFDEDPVRWAAEAQAVGIDPADFFAEIRKIRSFWYPWMGPCRGPHGPSVRAHSSSKLAPLAKSSINTDVIRRWDAELGIGAAFALDHIEKIDVFRSLFISEYEPHIRRSVFSSENVDILINADTAARASAAPFGTMKVFVVDKKPAVIDGLLQVLARFIIDCTPLNRCMRRPPNMQLPPFHDLLHRIGSFKHIMTQDAISYFYQFKTSEEIAAHFSFACNNARGRAQFMTLSRGAMGWSFMPWVSMTVSRLLCAKTVQLFRRRSSGRCLMECWLDNMIFGADSDADLKILHECFQHVATEANVAMHPPEFPVDGIITILGLDCNVIDSTFVFAEKWRKRVAEHLETCDNDLSYRNAVRPIGCLVFAAFVSRVPLRRFTSVRSCMTEVGRDIADGHRWDDPVRHREAWPEVKDTMTKFFSEFLAKPQPLAHDLPRGRWVVSQSDASAAHGRSRWGWCSGTHAESADFEVGADLHIFLGELRACLQNIKSVADSGAKSLVQFTDNLAVMYALRRGHSGNGTADAWLKRFFDDLDSDFRFFVTYVSTFFNTSDVYSRCANGHVGDFMFFEG
jgi:hypothetical protein